MPDEEDYESDVEETDQNEDTEHEVFINNNSQNSLYKIDEETRHLIAKRVIDREMKFNDLSLGDDFIEMISEIMKRDHNLQKMMLSNNRLTSRGAMAIMNKVSNLTNWLDISNNPEIRIDAYKFLSKYILQDYRK